MVSMIMSLMIMPLMIMSLMRMTMIIQFLPMNVFNTFYIITDFFYDHGYIFILACDRVCDLGHDRVCGRVYDHVYGHDHVNSFCDHVLAFHHQLKIFFYLSSLYDNFNLMLMY